MSSVQTPHDLEAYCQQMAQRARVASRRLARLHADIKNRWLIECASGLVTAEAEILEANARDIEAGPGYGLSAAEIDRLRLTPARIQDIAEGLRQVAALPDPVGEVIDGHIRPNGLRIEKVRVPLGVVFFIYESRPNVTADAAAICVKSGNAVILRGGKEALHSSQAILRVMDRYANRIGLPQGAVQFVDTTDRAAVGHFLSLGDYIDVTIPRGGESLIRRVVAEATMPVIKHYDGNCHVYVDAAADLEMALQILVNSKTQRMGVCNAAESLLVHQSIAAKFLPRAASALEASSVEIRGDATTCQFVPRAVPATDADWSTEFLGPIISAKVVANVEEAIEHINRFGSHHTDAIVTNDLGNAQAFIDGVDSAAVMVNASTRFNDGGQFGLGAEIGISTDKFHARGPCGLRELTSYKYIVRGNGQLRT